MDLPVIPTDAVDHYAASSDFIPVKEIICENRHFIPVIEVSEGNEAVAKTILDAINSGFAADEIVDLLINEAQIYSRSRRF